MRENTEGNAILVNKPHTLVHDVRSLLRNLGYDNSITVMLK